MLPGTNLSPVTVFIGGGVWESNPPEPVLTVSQTVLKTAPFTRTDAPPGGGKSLETLRAPGVACQATAFARLRRNAARNARSRLSISPASAP